MGSTELLARALMNKATALVGLGDLAQAASVARIAVGLYADLDDTWDLVDALDVLAGALGRSGSTAEAGWLFGGAASLRAALDVRRPVTEQRDYDAALAAAREPDPGVFDTAYADGTRASIRQIVDRARAQEVTA